MPPSKSGRAKRREKTTRSMSNIRVDTSNLWTPAPTEFTSRSAIMCVWGPTGSGRSTLALTAPGPIAYLYAAEKVPGIIEDFAKKKPIKMHDFTSSFDGDIKTVAHQSMPVWKRFRAAYMDAFEWARTVVVDTDTQAYHLIRMSYFGDYKPARGRQTLNWGPVNSDWEMLIHKARANPKVNVIFISAATHEYGPEVRGYSPRTGNLERKGKENIEYGSDVVVQTKRGEEGEFYSTIHKAWMSEHLRGQDVPEPVSNFPGIMGLITGTPPSEWTK